ncbi:MAG TPA: DedA family protein [Gemmatimonadaceae bacterium]|nr:DedA family protein [Gemmatimonadaceae bacterium]
MSSLSYLGVALLMAIENIILPIPSELIMPLAGFQTANGRMKLARVILAGTIGSVAGSLPLYYLGCALGEERLRNWVEKYGRWMMLRGRDLERATKRFAGNNVLAVFIGQLIPGVRGLISLPAGVARMNVGLFLAANFAGTLIWCSVLAVAGRLLGANFTKIHKLLGPIGWSMLALLIAALIAWIFRRRHTHRAAKA